MADLNEYSLRSFGDMIADSVRMRAYRAALAKVIRPGAVVLDIGAGTGILSLLACALGAGKVYAVEPGDAIAVGIRLAEANGFADRIEFLQTSSFNLKLPRLVDVIVSDLHGVLPLHTRHIPSIVDARRRLLAPGGSLIPQYEEIRIQLVADAEQHSRVLKVWQEGIFGLDLSAALRWLTHQWRKADLSKAKLVGRPTTVIKLPYRSIESPNARGEAVWMIEEETLVHGLAAWFDATLADGVGFSNAPDQPPAIYGQAFFPFPSPISLARGDTVTATLAATFIGGDYIWQWNTRVTGADGRQKVAFVQSTFQGAPLNPEHLRARAGDFVPTLGAKGLAAARALALMRERKSVRDIAATLSEEFPAVFAGRPGAAHELVGDLAGRFSQGTSG